MSNKKIFKKLYSNKINKDYNYQEILKKIENKNKKVNILKHSLIPIASLSLASFLIFININEQKSSLTEDTFSDANNNNQIFTNEIKEESNVTTSSNQEIKNTSYEEIINSSNYTFLTELNIPNDINNKIYQKVYIKDNQNKDYQSPNHYQIYYQNNNDNREIKLLFSDKYNLINNYSDSKYIKKSKINNQEIIIYQNDKMYITSFNYNDIYFNIETNNLNKTEFTNLLKSIIK